MPEAPADFRNLRILLADDHAFIRNLIRGMLLRANVSQIHAAANGEEAMNILRQRGNSIDCVISDWNMPPSGGLEVLRDIRTGTLVDVPANLPFIMLTGHADSKVVTAALHLDVSAYIVKPASSQKLSEAIQKSLAKTFTVKPARIYKMVPGIDLPAPSSAPDDPLAWASWVKGGQQAVLSEGTQFIKREAVKLGEPVPEEEADRIKNIRLKQADRVKPGSVLVEDFCDDAGVPLINAGTVLSEKILQRVIAMDGGKGAQAKLWVGQRESRAR